MFQRNKQTSELNLQGRSLALATEKPPAWECLLFAQVILDDVAEAKLTLSNEPNSTASDQEPAAYALEFSSWGPDRMDEIKKLVNDIPKAVGSINSNLEEILGPPGQSGNLHAIISSARQVSSFCKRIVQWANTVSNTPVHPVWANVTKEMVAAYALPLIESIEQFAKDISQQIEKFLAAPPTDEATLKFSLNVDVIDTTRLMTAISEATGTVSERTEESARLMSKYNDLRQDSALAMDRGDAERSESFARQAMETLNEVGHLGMLWPPDLIPENLIDSLTEPARQYSERIRKSRELAEALVFAIDTNQVHAGRSKLKELKELSTFHLPGEGSTLQAILIERAEEILGPLVVSTDASSLQISYPAAGYVYLMVNPSMEGLVKIGKTVRDPRDRAKELGATTGVPTPFIPIFQAYVSDCSEAERYIHSCLDQRNCRVSANREFFRVLPTDAIEIMLDARTRFEISERAVADEN